MVLLLYVLEYENVTLMLLQLEYEDVTLDHQNTPVKSSAALYYHDIVLLYYCPNVTLDVQNRT